ncbi:MAG: TlyA family RNA methyltransferase [Candidatus Aminicenantes bacterium]|nr:TlyA family RNA methyltransferase [Candidatus Aminicenantes bacterium]
MSAPRKTRLDDALIARGLAGGADKALALIMAGDVFVNGQLQIKADHRVTAADAITVQNKHPFVSRGAFKLAKAIEAFAITVAGAKALDLGISTGGFSDYLLQCGADRVCGVDVTISQVDYSLRQNPRLTLLEKNARFLQPQDVPFEPDLIIMDLSFISIAMVLPVLTGFAKAKILALVKPQFEAPKPLVGKGGVIRDAGTRLDVVLGLKRRIESMGFAVRGFTPSGLKGRKGNQEYFFLLEFGKKKSIDDTMLRDEAAV